MSSGRKHAIDGTILPLGVVLNEIRHKHFKSTNDEQWNRIFASVVNQVNTNPLFRDLDLSTLKNTLLYLVQTEKKHHELLQENQELLQENQKTNQENQELLRANQELIQENQELIEEKHHDKKKLKMYFEKSILGLLQLKKSESFIVFQKGTASSHVYPKHAEASTEEKPFNLSSIPIADKDEKEWKELKDTLCDKNSFFLNVDEFVFSNEADLQTYIHMAVLDAVYICNKMIKMAAKEGSNVQKLSHRREASYLSPNKPDHTVIFDSTFGIDILTIEDKKPLVDVKGETVDIISTKPKVAGQVYDFLIAMSALGHPNPFGIFTTLKETQICWVEDNSIANLADRFKFEAVEMLVQGLPMSHQTTTPPAPERAPEPTTQRNKRVQSTLKVVNKRMVCVSQEKYEIHQLVPVICNAIFCGMQNIQWQKRNDSIHNHGTFLQLFSEGYCWAQGTLWFSGKPACKSSILNPWNQPKKFTVLKLLGVGETSRALLAVTEKGNECVIKMYIRKFEEDRELSERAFNINAKKAVDREVKNYQKIYPELKANVWSQELNGFHCVVLPYFKSPVRNEGTYKLIRDVLATNFKKSKLRYATSDIRWRHVGMLDEKKLYLYDLADLVLCRNGDEFDKYIDLHINVLKERMDDQNAQSTTPTIASVQPSVDNEHDCNYNDSD